MKEALSTLNLVKHYFNICNTALAKHKDELILGSVIDLLNQYGSGETITLKVVDASGTTHGHYTTRYVDGEFTPVMEGRPQPADATFTLRRGFLEQVLNDADDYIEHPERLDWGWLTAA